MTTMCSQLLALLDEETRLYRSLLEALDDESRHLSANDASGVLVSSRRKDTIALQIRSVEESRLLLTEKFARSFGLPVEEVTISLICESAPEGSRSDLLASRDRLKSVVVQASELNERNRVMAETSLRLLQGTMEALHKQLLKRSGSAEPGYGPTRGGSGRGASSGGLVTHRLV